MAGGIGIIVRDDHGHCTGSISQHAQLATSAFHVEALALRFSLELIHAQHWDIVDIEEDLSDIGRIIKDSRGLMAAL